MTGVVTTADGTSSSLRDALDVLRRRRRPLLWTLSLMLGLTLAAALFWPATFRSTGTILIEQQEIPQDLVRSTVTSYADERVQIISQRVMTTQNLLAIIRRYSLYESEQRRLSREEVIQRMRDDIAFRMISADVVDPRSGIPRKASIAFSVSFDSRSPDVAAQVANELVSLYLNENLASRTRLAQDTTVFLQQEAEKLAREIAEVEARLAAFKEQNFEILPELNELNFQIMDRTQQELRDAQMRASALDQQVVFLQAQLAQLRPNAVLLTDSGERVLSADDRLKILKSQRASARALYSADHPTIQRLDREIAGLEAQTGGGAPDRNELRRRLQDAQSGLLLAQQRYSDDHPDVRRLTREVDELTAELQTPVARPQAYPEDLGAADNPAYIQIRAQLRAAENERSALLAKIAQLRGTLSAYERKLAKAPEVEKRYRELSRNYEAAQLGFQEVRNKQMQAELAQNLESDRKGEKFTLIDPPLVPEQPVSPNRLLVLTLGLLFSLGAAASVVVGREALDPTVRGRRDLLGAAAGLPILAIVPVLGRLEPRAAARGKLLVFVVATAAVAVAGGLAVHFLYRPLDVLWFAALRRFGL